MGGVRFRIISEHKNTIIVAHKRNAIVFSKGLRFMIFSEDSVDKEVSPDIIQISYLILKPANDVSLA